MKDVTAAIVLKGDRVFVARRPAHVKLGGLWEFPGGRREPGESPEECLAREMKEEFGAIVRIGEFFMESLHQYDFGAIRLLAYFTHCDDEDLIPLEHSERRWASMSELAALTLTPADVPIAQSLIRHMAECPDFRGEVES